jgi:hypothetical protein
MHSGYDGGLGEYNLFKVFYFGNKGSLMMGLEL